VAVCFILQVRVKPGEEQNFLQRYDALQRRVSQGIDGHVVHYLAQSLDDSARWVIASHWESLEASQEWERSQEHHDLTMPMRECWDDVQRSRCEVRLETRRGSG